MSVDGQVTPVAAPHRRMGLALKFALAFIGLVTSVLVINGAINLWLSYEEAKRSAVRVQQEKAQAAAERINLFISDIESQMGWTTRTEWARVSLDQRRYDFIRLLRQAPAITELVHIDGTGKEQLKLSRLEPDVVGSGTDYAGKDVFTGAVTNKNWFSPVYFRRGSEPYMTVALAHAGRNPGVTVAEVNLKLIWDVVSSIRIGDAGYAYIVDAKGRLIAHPDMSLVLRETDLSRIPQVSAALAQRHATAAAQSSTAETATGLDGSSILIAHAPIPRLNWLVFVQLPTRESLAPVYASLAQTGSLLGFGLILATLMGSLLARRMVVPIQQLQAGAQRLGDGDLSQRIDVRTGDEIETLARRFNTMASRIQDAQETLETKVVERTSDLNEALRHQTGTGKILQVIAASPTNIKPVLQAVAESACDVCDANDCAVLLKQGGDLLFSAHHGPIPIGLEKWPINRRWTAGRAVMDRRIVHVHDLQGPEGEDFPEGRELSVRMGHRTIASVPLMREGESIGAMVVRRTEPQPFSDKQLALLQTFADQAIIAINNVRLFEEVQARTQDLSTSLEELRTTQDRLIQTEKLASLGQLTAGIAHEIKNPLNFVNNFAALSGELLDELDQALAPVALDDAVRDEVSELTGMLKGNLAKVVQHGKRADSIVKNMLLHSREGAGDHRPVDINAIAEESLNLAYHGARAEKPGFNITLHKKLDPAAGEVDLYPQEITRVLLNLITNGFYAAAKRKTEGDAAFEPSLTLSTRNLGDRVEIKVRDNGTGIPPEVKAKMFNPFFTTKPAGEGTGLGLSLSHDIVVKQHGGTIDVDTVPGSFTEFTVVLPRVLPVPAGKELA